MGNLSVKITADLVDMQTKFAVAKAEVNGLTAEMNKLARASAAGTIDSAGTARMRELAASLLQARSEASGYAGAMERAGVSLSGLGRSAEMSHGQISVATREFRALFDELSSGRTRYTPGTLAIIANKVLGLNASTLLAAGGVAGLVGGLAYLGIKALEASRALDQVELAAQFAGNLTLSRQQIQQYADEMSQAGNISSANAAKIMSAFASLHDITTPQIHALTALVSDYSRVTGESADKAGESMARIFAAHESAAEFAKSIGGATQAQIDMAQAADRSGDAVQINQTKIDLLSATLERSSATINQNNASVTASVRNYLAYAGAMEQGISAEELNTEMLEDGNRARERQLALLRDVAFISETTRATPEQTLKVGVEAADKENPVAQQVEEAQSKIAQMTAALEVARQRSDQIDMATLNAGLAKARENLSNLEFGPALERMRTDMAQVAATWDGTQTGMLAKQREVAAQTLASVQGDAKTRLAVQQEIAHLDVEIQRTAGEQVVGLARTQVSQINADSELGAVQRRERERDVWQQILNDQRLTASQRLEVERQFNQAVAQLNRERQQQATAIARSDADTDIAIGRMRIEAEKQTLEAQTSANRTAAAQRFAVLRDLTNKEAALDVQRLQLELQLLTAGTAEYERVYNQIRELKAKLNVELAALDRQAAQEASRDAKEQSAAWKKGIDEIESAESSLIGDLISRRRSLSQSLLQITASFVQQEIANDVKAMTTKLLLASTEANAKKALDQGGLLYQMFADQQDAASTVRTEAAKTQAVTAGAIARQTATDAAEATGKAERAATGGATVMADAAKAFSGTYASVSAIPVVGWAIAPFAAAGAFAAVAAYEGMASLDTGAWTIPQDMVAQLHRGETVVPTPFAEGMRQSAGGSAGAGAGDVNHNYSGAIGAIHVNDSSLKRALSSHGNRRALVDALTLAVRRGARPR